MIFSNDQLYSQANNNPDTQREEFHPRVSRSRSTWLLLTFATMGIGLSSRKFGDMLPPFLADNSGDALWALMVFFGWGVIFPKMSTWRIAGLAIAFAYLIEFSQLIQWPWLNRLRENPFAKLVLGQGFLWVDLLRYAAGIFVGVTLEVLGIRKRRE